MIIINVLCQLSLCNQKRAKINRGCTCEHGADITEWWKAITELLSTRRPRLHPHPRGTTRSTSVSPRIPINCHLQPHGKINYIISNADPCLFVYSPNFNSLIAIVMYDILKINNSTIMIVGWNSLLVYLDALANNLKYYFLKHNVSFMPLIN